MKSLIYLATGVIFLFCAQACRDNKKGRNYNQAQEDQDGIVFIKSGIEGGLTEIKASGLAITNSNNQKVIGLAKMLIDDHTKTGDDLKQLEIEKKIYQTDTINSAHQKLLKDLSQKSGKAFDKMFLQMMVLDHEQAVILFTNASANTDSKIKMVATQNLPTIKMHLDSANAICLALK
jgi:putative membrane protein